MERQYGALMRKKRGTGTHRRGEEAAVGGDGGLARVVERPDVVREVLVLVVPGEPEAARAMHTDEYMRFSDVERKETHASRLEGSDPPA